MQMSVDNGLLGVSLFAFSYEDDAVWDRIAEINATLETVPADNSAPTTAAPTTGRADDGGADHRRADDDDGDHGRHDDDGRLGSS